MLTRTKAAIVIPVAASALLVATAMMVRAAEDKPAPAPAPASSVGAAASANDATGTWTWSIQGPGGNDVTMTLKLKQDGDKLTGTITGFGGQETEIQDGTVKDQDVTFKIIRDFAGTKSTTTYTGKLADGSLKGKSETVFTREFDAKKEK